MAPLVVLVCLAVGIASASPSPAANGLFSLQRESLAEKHVRFSELLDMSDVQKPGPNVQHIRPLQEGGKMRTPKAETKASAFKLCEYLDDDSSSTILSPGKYVLSSPNHPENYLPDLEISWTFTAETNQNIGIVCPELDVEGRVYNICSFDWLEINGVRFCGKDSVEEISADSLILQFVSDSSLTGKGFRCDIVVTESAAPISGPVGGYDDSCSCGLANRASRIVGGVQTEQREYPWQAGILGMTDLDMTICGGSVINSAYVLTAAHCFRENPSLVWVILGTSWLFPESEDEIFDISSLIIHPLYNDKDTMYDYALVHVLQPILFGPHISPVCLPTPGEMYSDAMATASGYGRTSNDGTTSDVLLEVDLRVWSPLDCEAFTDPRPYNDSILLCAGGESGKDTCTGDSGGPLVTEIDGRYVLIGVTSFGVADCATAGYPGLYARVTGVLDWIYEETANSTYCA